MDDDRHGWLREGSQEPDAVRRYYDDWADDYDTTLRRWDYRAPADAASSLGTIVPASATILDAGCGTGLVGRALREAGFTGPIDGLDLSPTSLDRARARGIYRDLAPADFQTLPLPVGDDAYDATVCVGVLTYVDDAETLFRDFARVTRPGGAILFTQRDDLFAERGFSPLIDDLASAGLWTPISISEPRLYLPSNDDFADQIKAIHVACRVAT